MDDSFFFLIKKSGFPKTQVLLNLLYELTLLKLEIDE